MGLAQTSQGMASTEYGKPVKDPGSKIWGITIREPVVRGYGIRCYLPLSISDHLKAEYCPAVCLTPREIKNIPGFDKKYELEPIHSPTDPTWAAEQMRRRIKQVIDTCSYGPKVDCNDTDKFIIAALSQNGSGFTIANMDQSIKIVKNNFLTIDHKIKWKVYFPSQGNEAEFKEQLGLFYDMAKLLQKDGYHLPSLDDQLIQDLRNGRYGP